MSRKREEQQLAGTVIAISPLLHNYYRISRREKGLGTGQILVLSTPQYSIGGFLAEELIQGAWLRNVRACEYAWAYTISQYCGAPVF
jgi:hypothetical protein